MDPTLEQIVDKLLRLAAESDAKDEKIKALVKENRVLQSNYETMLSRLHKRDKPNG